MRCSSGMFPDSPRSCRAWAVSRNPGGDDPQLAGEVRFQFDAAGDGGANCPTWCPRAGAEPWAGVVVAENGADVLRSINPVRNKAPCAPCAAAMAEPEPPFPIAKDVIEGYFDPGETPATSGWPTCWRTC